MILAYNTPESLPIENVLRDLAAHDSRFCLLRVEESRSKAENVNAALAVATGEIVAVYDADHLPEPDCFRKAWRWLARGYHVVQGRCVIRNFAENWLTRTVAVEFDSIYAISHQGRSNISGTAIFGGSNGYWRRDALRAVGMNPAMLTEDIDSSVRTLLAGRRLIHDRSILSLELAPTRAEALVLPAQAVGAGLAGGHAGPHPRALDAVAAPDGRTETALVLSAGVARGLPAPGHAVFPADLRRLVAGPPPALVRDAAAARAPAF